MTLLYKTDEHYKPFICPRHPPIGRPRYPLVFPRLAQSVTMSALESSQIDSVNALRIGCRFDKLVQDAIEEMKIKQNREDLDAASETSEMTNPELEGAALLFQGSAGADARYCNRLPSSLTKFT